LAPFSIPAMVNIVPEHAAWHEERYMDYNITTMFQPVFSAVSGRVFGYEALARASDDARRAIPTVEIISQLNTTSMFDADMLFRRLHLLNYNLVDDGKSTIMINMTPSSAVKELEHPQEFSSALRAANIDGRRVCIEILEHQTADELMLRDAAQGYRELGCLIAIDDFGIGASKFERVETLRPDIVKIDRHLLMDAVSNKDARQVLPWMIELLHRQDARVLIEGVEEIGEALVALESGADYLQGFYFAMPYPGLRIDPICERILSELIRMSDLDQDEPNESLRSYHPDHPKSEKHRTIWEAANPDEDNRAAIMQLMREFLSAHPVAAVKQERKTEETRKVAAD
jgi:EAL domain-containing protein (putative c-di-GMP-specific phosphodiesterase class I)